MFYLPFWVVEDHLGMLVQMTFAVFVPENCHVCRFVFWTGKCCPRKA